MTSRLKFGFECEHFVENPLTEEILYTVPSSLPMDGNGHLVETRSLPYNASSAVLESFLERRELLAAQLSNLNLRMVTKDSHTYPNKTETAGFHIHFSKQDKDNSVWWSPDELQAIISKIKAEFGAVGKIRTVPFEETRQKPYGWEYRRLPATIDPANVAKWLMKEFKQ